METMDDYRDELEASLKRIRVGDVVTGTVIDVTEDAVLVDLKTYADGIIRREDLSEDPDFNMEEAIHPGDEITATVMATNDGEGNMVLSGKEANSILAWERLKKLMEERTVVPVKLTEIVKSGAVAYLEGIRGFIPASRLSDEYVEELDEWKGKTIDVTVITADEEEHRLVMSGREAAREKKQEERNSRIARCETGAVMNGTVETLKPYGAFVALENGLTGLLHISQISTQRIKHPGVVLKEGQEVKVKIISTADHKISLSMKALAEGRGDAFASAGNSGALTVGATMLVKRMKGVKRGAFAPVLPTAKTPFMVCDGGANVACRADMLMQFGLMGSVYMEKVMKVKSPRVGLVNVGTESHKGDELRQEAYGLLKNCPGLNFIGNIEPRDIPYGACDVAVADGFTGNTVLKLYEGTALAMMGMVKDIFKKSLKNKLAAGLIYGDLQGLKKTMDYNSYGGAPLIGAAKPVFKMHGNTKAYAVQSALKLVRDCTESGYVEAIGAALGK